CGSAARPRNHIPALASAVSNIAMYSKTAKALVRAVLFLAASSLIGYGPASPSKGQSQEKAMPTSPVPIAKDKPIRGAKPAPPPELFYGEGDCAPRFPNGMHGTCINNEPCNGFGMRSQKGEIECSCFGVRGGCEEGLICSRRYQACVPPQQADFLR